MSDEYSRGYAAGLRELDHGHSFAEVERLRGEAASLRSALEEIKNRADSIQAYGIRDIARQALGIGQD